MDKVIVFIVVSVILALLLNREGSERCIRDKDDMRKLTFRFRSGVRWIALIGEMFWLLLFYKGGPEYLNSEPVNWFGAIVMALFAFGFLWFYVYVTMAHVIIWDGERIIHRFPFWKKELVFNQVKELVWTIDRGGGHYVIKGENKKITVHPMYVDYFGIKAVVQRNCKQAKKRKINKF